MKKKQSLLFPREEQASPETSRGATIFPFSDSNSFRRKTHEQLFLQKFATSNNSTMDASAATFKSSGIYPIGDIVESAIKQNANILARLQLNKKIDFASEPATELGPSATEEQIRAYSLLKERHPIVAILGPGGTGKSQFIEWIQDRYRESGRVVDVTATTGYAAYQIRGVTFYRYLNLRPDWYKLATGLSCRPEELDLKQFSKLISFYHRARHVCNRIINTDLLIIDEISMIDGPTLLVMDMICRYIRQKPHESFGGIQCLWSGDFLQLPPVNSFKIKPTPSPSSSSSSSTRPEDHPPTMAVESTVDFVFQYFAWKDIWKPKIQIFSQNLRSKDPRWSELLHRMRVGQCNEEDIALLKSRTSSAIVRSRTSATLPSGAVLTHVFPYAKRVQEFNEKERIKLKERDHRFVQPIRLCLGNDTLISIDDPIYRQFCQKVNTDVIMDESTLDVFSKHHPRFPQALCAGDTYSESILDKFLDDLKFTDTVLFRVGEKIMLRENLFQKEGLVNGSTGKIIGYTKSHEPLLDFMNMSYTFQKKNRGGEDISTVLVTPEQYDTVSNGYPVVHWSNGLITLVPFTFRKIVLATIEDKTIPPTKESAAPPPNPEFAAFVESFKNNENDKEDKESKKPTATTKTPAKTPAKTTKDLSILIFILPIQSAAAITSHKCQGLTIPYVYVGNPEKCFEHGMFYVMCSRAPSLNQVFLDDSFHESHIRAHPDAVGFFETVE